jgi:hypothetical protein
MIKKALAQGSLEKLYPGVYVLPGLGGKWMTKVSGAVLGSGPNSAASHRTAAQLLELDGFNGNLVEVTSSKNIRWPRVVAHKATLTTAQTTSVKGIATTSPAETLLCLGAMADEDQVEGAVDSALVRGLVSVDYLLSRLEKSPKRAGHAIIRRLLDERTKRPPTDSELERLYDRNITRKYGFPNPHPQFKVLNTRPHRRIDFAYPKPMLGVDVLGWKDHGKKSVWQTDWQRHNQLTNLGWELLYFTWLDVKKHPERVATEVRAALDRRTRLFI